MYNSSRLRAFSIRRHEGSWLAVAVLCGDLAVGFSIPEPVLAESASAGRMFAEPMSTETCA